MSGDLIRQELEAWIKAQQEALPERREAWAHGAAETLRDLHRELDRIFGEQNADSGSCQVYRVCSLCFGAGGHTGLFGRWEPCPECDPPTCGGDT